MVLGVLLGSGTEGQQEFIQGLVPGRSERRGADHQGIGAWTEVLRHSAALQRRRIRN